MSYSELSDQYSVPDDLVNSLSPSSAWFYSLLNGGHNTHLPGPFHLKEMQSLYYIYIYSLKDVKAFKSASTNYDTFLPFPGSICSNKA